jgi:hypothetical protein
MQYRLFSIVGALFALGLLLQPAQPVRAAVEITQLYQARVAVASQATQERTRALQQALSQTLLRISGDDQLLLHPLVLQALRNVPEYLMQYGYQQLPDQLQLWVQFDQDKINQLIQSAESGIWSNLRPELLVWLVREDERLQRQLLGSDEASELVMQLRTTAQQRGLPLKLPLLDLNDSMAISPIDVWGRFDDALSFASARYPHDGVIVARIYQADPILNAGYWVADWTLQLGDIRWRGEVTSVDQQQLGALLVAQVSRELAQRYRISSSATELNQWQMTVHDLSSLPQVIGAEQLLASLPSVDQVQLIGFGNTTAVFLMSLQADPNSIVQALDLSRQLRPLPEPGHYRWVAD